MVSGIAAPGRQASKSEEQLEQMNTDAKVSDDHVGASRSRKRLPCDMEIGIDGALGSQALRYDDSVVSVRKVKLKRVGTQVHREGLTLVDVLPVGDKSVPVVDKSGVDTGDRRRASQVGGSGWRCGQDVDGVFVAAVVDIYSTPTACSKPSEEISANLPRQMPDMFSVMLDTGVLQFGSRVYHCCTSSAAPHPALRTYVA